LEAGSVEQESLAESFESQRGRLRAIAYRMLGSLSEAEDAVQEAWLRLSRVEARASAREQDNEARASAREQHNDARASAVDNLAGWLTTVVARVCLDMLRQRKARREDPLDLPARSEAEASALDPETESVMADSVGLALLVVLETLTPAERLAFVMHDMFALPFDQIAPMIGSTSENARQLASRARRRVQGGAQIGDTQLNEQRAAVDAFLAAVRSGDFDALVAVLHPDAAIHADASGLPAGAPTEIHGVAAVARGAIRMARGAVYARPALVDGQVGIVVAPQGKLIRVLRFTLEAGKIARIDVLADAARLAALELGVVDA
jgi:RNA polymerase sigma-70 factor (ECF subfamily)